MGFWMTLFVYAVIFVLSDLLRPKPQQERQKPAGLGDFRFPTATEQRRVPLIWGTVKVEGPNVVWWGDLTQEAIEEEVKTGLFSSQDVVRGFRYYLGIQHALCMGPLSGPDDGLFRVWIDKKVVLDPGSPVTHDTTFTINAPDLFGGEEFGGGGVVGTLRFFAGTNTQSPSSYLSQFQKEPPVTGDTPAYRDICYIAPDETSVLLGTSTSIAPWAFELRRIPNGLGLTLVDRLIEGGANPANVLYEVITNTDWGYGESASDVDTVNFAAVAGELADEGNGFSFILDQPEDTGTFVKRVEDQIDGILFKNPFTSQWQIRLARADYDIDVVPEVTAGDNLIEIRTFTRSTWEGTTNQVHVPISQADDEYKDTFGFAQDMANVRVLGANVTTDVSHPGIKSAQLADDIAWRELRTLSIPLVQAQLVVDRSLFGVLPYDVVAFTDEDFGFVKLPMRVKSVDYGDLLDGKIVLDCVQDVFFSAAGTFDPPPVSGWTPPVDELVAFPADEQRAFESPRMLTVRDPASPAAEADKVYAAARRQGPEVQFQIRERNDAGSPSGPFSTIGTVFGFQLIGELQSSLGLSATNPQSTIVLVPDPDTQASLIAAFPDVADANELGNELLTLCLIDDEFILPTSAQSTGANVQLNSVYRGVGDSVQASHASGARVYLLFVGAGMSSGSVPAGNNVDVKLIPRSVSDTLDEASATTISFQMDDRTRRPYPPASFDLNGTTLDQTNVDLDGSGSGEDVGILVDEIVRRDFRLLNEVASLLADAATLASDFPAANTTTVEVEVRDGVTVLTTTTGISGTSTTVRQLDILAGLDTTPLPSSLTIGVRQSHIFEGTAYDSRYTFDVTFTVDSPLVGEHAFGELDQNEEGAVYLVQAGQDGTDHDFTLSTAFTVGNVEYELDNSGTWITLIVAGMTTGSIPNAVLSVGTEIRVRHGSTDTNPQKLLTMTVGGTEEAYGVLIS